MTTQSKNYITAPEVAEALGVSVGYSYKIIRALNNELKDKGYLAIAGKVPRRYFQQRCYGYEA